MSGNLIHSAIPKAHELGIETDAKRADSTKDRSSPYTPSNTHEDPRIEDDESTRNEVLQGPPKFRESKSKESPRSGTNRNAETFRFQRRLNAFLINFATMSAVFLLGAIAFLTFLWYSGESNLFWRRIVRVGWITRSVTLSAVILRITVSIQAGIATSMMAALAIEKTGIQFFDILELSVIRFSNSGPYQLFWLCAKRPNSIVLLLLLGLLSTSTLVIQFASTALLSDVKLLSIKGSATEISVSYGFEAVGLSTEPSFQEYANVFESHPWTTPILEHHSFGEYAVPVDRIGDVDDTGTIIRAIIPIMEKDEREHLLNYHGPASVFDSRVVCVQPNFLTMELCNWDNISAAGRLCGKVAPRRTFRDAAINTNGSSYSCFPAGADGCQATGDCFDRRFTLCSLTSPASGGLISALDPTNNGSLTQGWYPSNTGGVESSSEYESGVWAATNGNQTWWVTPGNAYLIFNATSINLMWNESSNPTYNGPWATFRVPSSLDANSNPETVHVSLCYDALPSFATNIFQDLNISLSRNHTHKEPTLRPNATFRGFDVTNVRQQLGVSPSEELFEERGILALSGEALLKTIDELRAAWVPPKNFVAEFDGVFDDNDDSRYGQWFDMPTEPWVVNSVLSRLGYSEQVHFCVICASFGFGTVASPAHTLIFSDMLINTGSPAHALQAFLTIILRSNYYTWLPMANVPGKATIVSSTQHLAPVSSRGYWITMAIVAAHITTCIIITYLFWSRTRHSLVGNIWSSFAQVACTEQVQTILQEGTKRTDKEILSELKKTGELRRRFRIELTKSGDVATLAPMYS